MEKIMSLSMRIAAHLPLLRRYARAVSGSQTSGDAYVSATLEALIADVSIFPEGQPEGSGDRAPLYKLFATIFSSAEVSIPDIDTPYAWERRASEYLTQVASKPRQAFLLASVEDFSMEEIAYILGTSQDQVGDLLRSAAEEISTQVMTEIMIIEDEPIIAMDIEQMVEELGHTVTGIARTKDEAVALFHKTQPKMVLADIQLADGSSGIDAVNEILKTSSVPVIFITAFPEKLLTGERPEPAFLVTKPFNPDMVKALISQALFFSEAAAIKAA
jgi:CheY-like chemotaxis protein